MRSAQTHDFGAHDFDASANDQDDLGWNDFGSDPVPLRLVPAVTSERRAAFTLRLDSQRHFKLRLASTVHECSAQALVTEALDRFLDTIPQLESLAAQARAPSDQLKGT